MEPTRYLNFDLSYSPEQSSFITRPTCYAAGAHSSTAAAAAHHLYIIIIQYNITITYPIYLINVNIYIYIYNIHREGGGERRHSYTRSETEGGRETERRKCIATLHSNIICIFDVYIILKVTLFPPNCIL